MNIAPFEKFKQRNDTIFILRHLFYCLQYRVQVSFVIALREDKAGVVTNTEY